MDNPEEPPPSSKKLLIGIVGPCAAGKSTLIERLGQMGYRVRHIAQEHSYVKDMWQRLTHPDILIFLDATYPTTVKRRKLDWSVEDWQEQQRRLSHAKEHANLYIETDQIAIEEVLQKVVNYIEDLKQL
jgi:guanylate kinase